jgi:hypothetical protein
MPKSYRKDNQGSLRKKLVFNLGGARLKHLLCLTSIPVFLIRNLLRNRECVASLGSITGVKFVWFADWLLPCDFVSGYDA